MLSRPAAPAACRTDLVTCGIGANDIFYTMRTSCSGDLRALVATLPDDTVILDLPLPAGLWGPLGLVSLPYVARINRTIYREARARGLPVAEVSRTSGRRGAGKFASDCFHPSQTGYRDWALAPARRPPPAAGWRDPAPAR